MKNILEFQNGKNFIIHYDIARKALFIGSLYDFKYRMAYRDFPSQLPITELKGNIDVINILNAVIADLQADDE